MSAPATPRPFQAFLVDDMRRELNARQLEYRDERLRLLIRFSKAVDEMFEELSCHRTAIGAAHLLKEVSAIREELAEDKADLERQ